MKIRGEFVDAVENTVAAGPLAALVLRWLGWKPVKRGLVRDPGDWKWSSFRHYAFREMGVVEIESEWTGRDRELKVTGGQPRVFLCPS